MTREEMINFGEMFLEVNEDSKNSNIYEFIEKALGLLKQEPCEDCVSRKAIDQNIYDYAESNGLSYANMKNYILDTPSVTPTQKWIPVTEDTPPKGTICLWCNKQGSVFASEITYRSECSSYVGKHGYFSNGLENYGDIVAWMPLPEPYRAEMESEQLLSYADQDTMMPAT